MYTGMRVTLVHTWRVILGDTRSTLGRVILDDTSGEVILGDTHSTLGGGGGG